MWQDFNDATCGERNARIPGIRVRCAFHSSSLVNPALAYVRTREFNSRSMACPSKKSSQFRLMKRDQTCVRSHRCAWTRHSSGTSHPTVRLVCVHEVAITTVTNRWDIQIEESLVKQLTSPIMQHLPEMIR